MSNAKLYIIGFDGATLDLIEPWVATGRLPNFASLMKEGAWGRLTSTIPPLTPTAWTSIVTGVNPGKHGIFDFGARPESRYEHRLIHAGARRSKPLWTILASAGKKMGVINVPMTYPPERLNGFMVTGMHTPDLRRGTYPVELAETIDREFPDYEIDAMSYWYQSSDLFLKKVFAMSRARLRLTLELAERFQPDCLMVVFVLTDRIQHALWKQSDLPSTLGSRAGWRYRNAIFSAYRAADRILGQFLKRMSADDTILVISDHGFGSLDKDVYLNRFLLDEGFMEFDADKIMAAVNPGLPPVHGRDNPQPFSFLRQWFNHPRTSLRLRKFRKGLCPIHYRTWEMVNWRKTVAYSQGSFGEIYLNVVGREPEGIVRIGQDYERIRDRITALLYRLTDPDDGGKIVDHVYRREELYHGPYLNRAPDLVVVMRNYAYITRAGAEFLSDKVVSSPQINHTGNHRLEGILLAKGPEIKPGYHLGTASVLDITPTVLHLMGLSLPPGFDGRPLHELLSTFRSPLDNAEVTLNGYRGSPGLQPASPDDELVIRERLKGLGYLSE